MITLAHVYAIGGVFFAAIAWFAARDHANPHRWRAAAFWALLALSFLAGDRLGDLGNGLLVVGLVVLGALGLGGGGRATSSPEERRASAERHGDRLFAVALVIPATALAGTLVAKNTPWGAKLIDPAQATLIALVLGVLLALLVARAWLRPTYREDAPGGASADASARANADADASASDDAGATARDGAGAAARGARPRAIPLTRTLLTPLREGHRLVSTVGWPAILPQMLASLGVVFLANGVGTQVGKLFAEHLPLDTRLAAVAAYCVGMAIFTMLMGNAFAAFPVMTAAVGLPVLVKRFGGDPATITAIGMLSGFCGTLMTPMAANFNVVPANLLELPDRKAPFNAVIRTQAPTAVVVLAANVALMWWLGWR